MDAENPILLKVVYKETKIKFKVTNVNQTIKELKQEISSKLSESGQLLQADLIECLDGDDFKLSNTDIVKGLLKDNDIIKIIELKPDNVVQQALNDQQEQQQVQQQQGDPAEAIVVLFDTSGSMSSSFYDDKDLPRIGAVNAFFSAFADKTLAFEYNHVIKLVSFSTNVVDKCDFTSDFNQFIKLVDNCNPGGSTALYDSIDYAITHLLKFREQHPTTLLRIIALTDGQDNISKARPQELVKKIIQNGIVIDSFVVYKDCIGLKTLTHASGGRCYSPVDINQGLQLFEVETILSVAQREKVTEKRDENINLDTLRDLPFDTEGLKAAQPKALSGAAMKREDIIKKYQEQQQQQQQQPQPQGKTEGKAAYASSTGGGGALKRILKEYNDLVSDPNLPFKAFPTQDMFNWRLFLLGPSKSLFENGRYLITVQFPNDYPFKPPKVQFVNKVYHPNVSRAGHICLDILKDQWSPALTITKVMLSLRSLLDNPNADDSLDSTIAAVYKHEPEQFKQNVLREKKDFASQSPVELAQYALGTDGNITQDEYNKLSIEIEEWLQKQLVI